MSLMFAFDTGCFVYINVCSWDRGQGAKLESLHDCVYGNENNIHSGSPMLHIARLLVLHVSSVFTFNITIFDNFNPGRPEYPC